VQDPAISVGILKGGAVPRDSCSQRFDDPVGFIPLRPGHSRGGRGSCRAADPALSSLSPGGRGRRVRGIAPTTAHPCVEPLSEGTEEPLTVQQRVDKGQVLREGAYFLRKEVPPQ